MISDLKTGDCRSFLATIMQLSILLLLTGISLPLYPATPSTEYKLKAALIYKLTKFIEWPEVQSDQSQSSFGICLLGEDLFGEALDELEERNVLEQSITVYRFSQSDAIDARCQIVFISKSKQAFVVPILQSLKDRPILTLSDMADFAKQGGMLQFTTGKKHVGFRINLESAKQSNFVIAAPLLDIATIISSKP